MGIKKFRPTTPSRRFITGSDFSEVTSKRPEKSLIAKQSKNGGRNNNGRITARHRGGGHKRRYRIVDFKRDKLNVPGKVDSIQYDPMTVIWIIWIASIFNRPFVHLIVSSFFRPYSCILIPRTAILTKPF